MFTRKEDETDLNPYMPSSGSMSTQASSAPAGVSSSASSSKEVNVIAKGTLIRGDVISEGDLRIDGELKGTIRSRSKVMVGPEGMVDGDVECVHAEVLGRMKGSLKVQDHLYLRGNARMEGDVLTTHFEMEPSVRFNGKCTMEDKVELSPVTRHEEKAAAPAAAPAAKVTGSSDKSGGLSDKVNGDKENKATNGLFQKQGA
jgi:cytoskeletal protein CcmA (bactofilin family)